MNQDITIPTNEELGLSPVDDDVLEILAPVRESTPQLVDTYEPSPLEDKNGQPKWINTRMCFCKDNDKTDCRFHSPTEPGWEVCPRTEEAKRDRSVTGRWLSATNPNYGKSIKEETET